MFRVRELLLAGPLCAAAAGLALAQPPERRENRPGEGAPADGSGAGPAFRVLPPFAQRELRLSPEQQQQIDALEAEVQAKMQKILTPEQLKQWAERRSARGPRGDQASPDRPRSSRRDSTADPRADRPTGADDARPAGAGERAPDETDSRRSRQGRGSEDRREGSPRGDRAEGPLERVVKQLDLTPEQQTKVDATLKEHHEKVRGLFRQAQADLLARMKEVLTDEQFQQFTKAPRTVRQVFAAETGRTRVPAPAAARRNPDALCIGLDAGIENSSRG